MENGILTGDHSWMDYSIFVSNIVLASMGFVLLVLWTTTRYLQNQMIAEERFIIDNPKLKYDSIFWSAKISIFDAFIKEPIVSSCLIHILFGLLAINDTCLWSSNYVRFEVTHWYFWTTFHLLGICNVSTTVTNVVRAVVLHYDQLLVTLMIMLFFALIYSNYTMMFFQNTNWNGQSDTIDCETLVDCFIYTIDLGLRAGGGIGDYMNQAGPHNRNIFWHQFLYEFSFFCIVNVICFNIIAGIIIDTFSQLRGETDERDHDKKHICFVCGLDRTDFNREGKDFENHLENQHDPWAYIYYIYYLQKKGEDELTGIEQFCYDNFKKLKTDWCPIGRTLYLKESNQEDEITECLRKVDSMNDKMAINQSVMIKSIFSLKETVFKVKEDQKILKNMKEDQTKTLYHFNELKSMFLELNIKVSQFFL